MGDEHVGPLKGGRINFLLGTELHDRVAAEAKRRDVSVSYLIRRAIERQLPAWEEQDDLA